VSSLGICDLYILLVEPSATQRKIIINHLQDEGIANIVGVSSGEEAIESMKAHSPDLVISSMYFDDMTGVELVHMIRESILTEDMPFMLISSETSFRMLEPIRQSGVVAILPKPFTSQDLHKALGATIDYIEPGELELELYDVEQLRVLVVDDSKLSRRHICRVIGEMGVPPDSIHIAENGKQAAKLFEDHEFDLVVTDLNMPEMDGNELVQFIRNESAHPYVPVLMVTSEQNNARLDTIQQAGVSAICDKPFEAANVKQMLMRMMNS
jgi:two-component system, chemotaxis family, chemotaxis protein CheY